MRPPSPGYSRPCPCRSREWQAIFLGIVRAVRQAATWIVSNCFGSTAIRTDAKKSHLRRFSSRSAVFTQQTGAIDRFSPQCLARTDSQSSHRKTGLVALRGRAVAFLELLEGGAVFPAGYRTEDRLEIKSRLLPAFVQRLQPGGPSGLGRCRSLHRRPLSGSCIHPTGWNCNGQIRQAHLLYR